MSLPAVGCGEACRQVGPEVGAEEFVDLAKGPKVGDRKGGGTAGRKDHRRQFQQQLSAVSPSNARHSRMAYTKKKNAISKTANVLQLQSQSEAKARADHVSPSPRSGRPSDMQHREDQTTPAKSSAMKKCSTLAARFFHKIENAG